MPTLPGFHLPQFNDGYFAMHAHPTIRFYPEHVTRAILIAIGILITLSSATRLIMHVTGHDYALGLLPMFWLGNENNIPTLFSVALLLASSMLLATTCHLENTRNGGFQRYWCVLAVGFAMMAIDEFVMLHERVIDPIRERFGESAGGVFYNGWWAPALVLVAALAWYFRRFLVAMPAEDRSRLILAGVVYLGGALGMEALGGVIETHFGRESVAWTLVVTAEESGEMIGLLLLIRALLLRASREYGVLRVDLIDPARPPASVRPETS